MSNIKSQLEWNKDAKSKYDLMLSKIPLFHREITRKVVDKMAPENAQERGSEIVEEQDIVKAFLTEVPAAFYSLMIRLMDDVGFDHSGTD